MGTGLRHIDNDKIVEKLNGRMIFLNDLDLVKDEALISRLLVTVCEDTTFTMIPSCSCGETSLDKYPEREIGEICEFCCTPIEHQTSRSLQSNLWIRPPKGITRMILPAFLRTLIANYKVGNSRFTVFNWLLDPYSKDYRNDAVIQYLEENGVKRGVQSFIDNFEEYMDILNNDTYFPNNRYNRAMLSLYCKNVDKNVIFPSYLPLVHKSFNLIERSHLGSYIDFKSFTPYMSTINTMVSLENSPREPSEKRKNSVLARFLFGITDYYYAYIRDNHNKKEGQYRQHVYGSRLPWTARAVITSIHGPHDHMEVHFPWTAAVPLYEIHLTNKLLEKGMKPNEVRRKIIHAVNNYDPEIDAIFDELIANSPHRTYFQNKPGLMILENRNPSLKMGSIQTFLITKIKKDPSDITKSLSVLCLSAFNADHDGDEMNTLAINDTFQAASAWKLAPHHTVLSHTSPHKLSGDVNLPKQTWSMIGAWLSEEDD